MDIYEKIISLLKEEYAAGATYQELADKYGVSYTHIHNLLNGKRAVSGISLDFFFKLFPKATISLSGGVFSPVVNNGHNSGTMAGVVSGIDEAVDKILADETLSAEEKVKFLKVLKK